MAPAPLLVVERPTPRTCLIAACAKLGAALAIVAKLSTAAYAQDLVLNTTRAIKSTRTTWRGFSMARTRANTCR